MNKDSQLFSLRRYALLLKCYLVENRKSLLTLCAVMWGVMILICVRMALEPTDYGYYLREDLLYAEFSKLSLELRTMILLFVVFGCLSGSIMFSTLKDRAGRIRVLMRPASMVEKFAVCLTVYVVLFAVAFMAGWAISDGLHSVISGCRLIWFVDLGVTFDEAVMYALVILFMQSLFALGSAVWPKRSFAKTFLCLFIFVLLSMFTNWIDWPIIRALDSFPVMTVTLSVLTVGVYALAWWRFRNVQLTQRFMN